MNAHNNLEELFPDYRCASRSFAWESLKHQFDVDQCVTGTVVGKSPFGAWIDLGVGFPALLEIVVMEGLTPERYRADDWCPLGSVVTAFIAEFRDRDRQIRLWQVRPGRRQKQEPLH